MRLAHTLLRYVGGRSSCDLPVRIKLWDGSVVNFSETPQVTVTLKSRSALRHFARPGLAGLGAAYIKGELDLEGNIWDIIAAGEAIAERSAPTRHVWRPRWRSKRQDAAAVQYHYDVSNDFYALFLDREMIYSCAYFRNGQEDIHQAQTQKLDHICRKLLLKPGEQFLDIGCGWGALVCWAAKHFGVQATGVTLSQQQWAYAQARIRAEGLEGRCRVLLCDYRDLPGEGVYDKVASVGMCEHVGLRNLPTYFGAVRRLLREGGLMLNHGITRPEGLRAGKGLETGDFSQRFVFPLGELPTLGQAVQQMARQDLEVVDVESLRPHYAQTLAHWVTRLEANRERAEALVGQRRYRIWRVYMAACVRNFERGGLSIHQVLATRKATPGLGEMPWTREHLYTQRPTDIRARVQRTAAGSLDACGSA